jgi:hypothetical protein
MFVAKAMKEQMKRREEDRQRRGKDGVGMFSNLSDFAP